MFKKKIRGITYVIVKGFFGVITTLLLSLHLEHSQFSIWILMVSINLFISLSDLGLGQFMVVDFVSIRKNLQQREDYFVNQNFGLLIGKYAIFFFLVSILLVLSAFTYIINLMTINLLQQLIIFLTICLSAIRMSFLPFLAILNAEERYDERKGLEALSLIIFFLFLTIGIALKLHFLFYVVVFQITQLLPSIFFYIQFKKRGLRINIHKSFNSMGIYWIKKLFLTAFPYFIINLCGFTNRMGIPLILSLTLLDSDVATIGLAATFFFQGGFQIVDVIVKLMQPNFKDYINSKSKLLFCGLICILSAFILTVCFVASTYLKTLNFDFEIYTLFFLLLIIEAQIYLTNSLSTMARCNAKNVASFMLIRSVALIFVGNVFSIKHFCLLAFITGIIYIMTLSKQYEALALKS